METGEKGKDAAIWNLQKWKLSHGKKNKIMDTEQYKVSAHKIEWKKEGFKKRKVVEQYVWATKGLSAEGVPN